MPIPRLPAVLLVACLLPCGCRVSKHEQGSSKNVDIGTPFGSMHVKTDQAANLTGLGITPYPGAMPYREDKDEDKDAADVSMDFGAFHLGVKAASYLSHDRQEQIIAFYKNDLAHYGQVIECSGKAAVGEPVRTAEGLTCDDSNGSGHQHVHISSGLELRAGSLQHQHIVSIEREDGDNKIGLVALDLPGSFDKHKKGEVE